MSRTSVISIAIAGWVAGTAGAAIHVAPGGAHVAPYDSWVNAATTIQAAIDVAGAGAEILVSNGVYSTGAAGPFEGALTRVAATNPVTLRSVNGPEVTIIQGFPESPGIRGVYVCSGAVVRGFTVTQGYAEGCDGGGAWCDPHGVLSNCWVLGNLADGCGGGVYGGFMTHGLIQSNTAYGGGGGSCGGTLLSCDVLGNQGADGGGMRDGSAVNSVLSGNVSAGDGGGAHGSVLTHCTVVDNFSLDWGGGVYGGQNLNSVIYGNSGGASYSNWTFSSFTNCCAAPLPAGAGNFAGDPLLVSFADPRLQSNSPCIDRVTNTAVVASDRAGTARPLDGNGDGTNRSDVGAFEHVHPSADSDADGLSDSNEVFRLGSNAASTDTDDDGAGDLYEFITGTSLIEWTAPGSLFGVTAGGWTGGGPVVAWPSVTGRLYTVYSTTNLPGDWEITAAADRPGTGAWMSYTNAPGAARLYCRVRVRLAS